MPSLKDIAQFLRTEDITPDKLNIRFRKLFDSHNTLEYVTTNPDGVRTAKQGYAVLLLSGGNYYLEVNVDSGTTWRGVNLTNTP